MEYSTSKETQENINKTFQELELTAKVIANLKQFSKAMNGLMHLAMNE